MIKRIITAALLGALLLTGCTSNTALISSDGLSSVDSSVSSDSEISSSIDSSQTSSTGSSSDISGTSSLASSSKASGGTSSVKSTTSSKSTGTVTPTGKTYTPVSKSLSGSISFSGSTSVYPVIAALTEAFKKQYPNVKVSITNVTGSGAGLADAKAGKVSFGMRSSSWNPADGANINPYQIALDGVAIVVNKSSTINDMSIDDIRTAFEGKYTGLTAPVSREAGSGTRTCFEDIMKSKSSAQKIPVYMSGIQYLPSTEAVATAVAGNPNSIGYMSLGAVGSNLKKVTVGGVEATEENVISGSYLFSRPFLLLRRNDRPLSTVEKEFLKFALSVQGQTIIHSSNYISLSSAQITAELAKVK